MLKNDHVNVSSAVRDDDRPNRNNKKRSTEVPAFKDWGTGWWKRDRYSLSLLFSTDTLQSAIMVLPYSGFD